MSKSVNEVLFEAVKNKLQTARESYSKYLSTMEDLNTLLKDIADYAVVADIKEFLQIFIEKIKEIKNQK